MLLIPRVACSLLLDGGGGNGSLSRLLPELAVIVVITITVAVIAPVSEPTVPAIIGGGGVRVAVGVKSTLFIFSIFRGKFQ